MGAALLRNRSTIFARGSHRLGEIPRDKRTQLVLLTKSSNAEFPQHLPSNQSNAILWALAISGSPKLSVIVLRGKLM